MSAGTGDGKILMEYGDIDARVEKKLREARDLDLRTHEQRLFDAFQHGRAVGETLRWYRVGFAFLMGGFTGLLIAAALAALSH